MSTFYTRFASVLSFTLCLTLLTSCAEIVSTIVESDLRQGMQNGQKPKGSHPSEKVMIKEQEQLKQSGKCPTCKGMGKTPDGRYNCSTCNGTGLAN